MSNHNNASHKITPMQKPLSDKESGTVEYTIGFFSKLAPGASDSATEIPKQILDGENFKKVRKTTLTDIEAAVVVTPPSDDFVSGILGIQVSTCYSAIWWLTGISFMRFANSVSRRITCP